MSAPVTMTRPELVRAIVLATDFPDDHVAATAERMTDSVLVDWARNLDVEIDAVHS